jgi:hypothetical protein
MSTVLENYYDPKYDPSEAKIEKHAKWLGLDLPREAPLLWIARDSLKAPLPENWKAFKSEYGELYFFNLKSEESIWDHPFDDQFKDLIEREREKLSAAKGRVKNVVPAAPLGLGLAILLGLVLGLVVVLGCGLAGIWLSSNPSQ